MANGNLRSKCNRAVAAYLVSKQCGTVADVLPANTIKPKTFPNTTVISKLAVEDPQFSGNRRITLYVVIAGKAQVAVDETNPDVSRTDFDSRVAKTDDMLRQTDNGQNLKATADDITAAGRALAVDASNGLDPAQVLFAKNNSDMADFTMNGWFPAGDGDGEIADDEGCSWKEVLIFEAVCCPANVD